jgi:hypothetical protein
MVITYINISTNIAQHAQVKNFTFRVLPVCVLIACSDILLLASSGYFYYNQCLTEFTDFFWTFSNVFFISSELYITYSQSPISTNLKSDILPYINTRLLAHDTENNRI